MDESVRTPALPRRTRSRESKRNIVSLNTPELLADEVRCVVAIAGALVSRDLGVRAQRPRHRSAGNVSGAGDGRRRLSLFPPALERTHPINLVGSSATAAVSHSGHHEQAYPVVLVLAHFREHAVVVNDGVLGLDSGVGPAV